jgi:hypothetical protein
LRFWVTARLTVCMTQPRMKMANPKYTDVCVLLIRTEHSSARLDMASWNRKKRKKRRPVVENGLGQSM